MNFWEIPVGDEQEQQQQQQQPEEQVKPVLYPEDTTESAAFHEEIGLEKCVDFVLNPEDSFVWIAVDNISVWIKRHEYGVEVKLYPKGSEDQDEMESCFAMFGDAERAIELKEKHNLCTSK
jgi:hypothetical protein